jgi:hypothetical protein
MPPHMRGLLEVAFTYRRRFAPCFTSQNLAELQRWSIKHLQLKMLNFKKRVKLVSTSLFSWSNKIGVLRIAYLSLLVKCRENYPQLPSIMQKKDSFFSPTQCARPVPPACTQHFSAPSSPSHGNKAHQPCPCPSPWRAPRSRCLRHSPPSQWELGLNPQLAFWRHQGQVAAFLSALSKSLAEGKHAATTEGVPRAAEGVVPWSRCARRCWVPQVSLSSFDIVGVPVAGDDIVVYKSLAAIAMDTQQEGPDQWLGRVHTPDVPPWLAHQNPAVTGTLTLLVHLWSITSDYHYYNTPLVRNT